MPGATGADAEPQYKHQWLRRALLADIGRMQANALLPTERELAISYGVSRGTVRHTLEWLKDNGIVYRVQGAGTFVSSPTISKELKLTSFTEDMTARGLTPTSRLLVADQTTAGAVIGEYLGIEESEPVIRLMRVRLADGVPMCLENVHLPASRVPGLLEQDLTQSLYETLDRTYHLRVLRADQRVQAVVLDESQAALLGMPPGSAALQVHRIGLDERDEPVECTTTIYRSDRYDLRFAVRRE